MDDSTLFAWTKQGEHYEVQTLQTAQDNITEALSKQEDFGQPQVPNSSKCEDSSGSFRCNECGKLFLKKNTYINHQRVHGGESTFQCGICEKSFVSSRSLLIHSKIHTEELSFHCNSCGKSFSQKSVLNIHKRNHSNEKMYQCNKCGKNFNQSNLTKLKKVNSEEKPILCGNCSKSFLDSNSLKQSIKKHLEVGPFVCLCCKEEFKKKCFYDLHMLGHKGIKPEECDICERKFPSKGLLASHMKNHQNGKLYNCDICDRQFIRVVTLKKHLKYYHGFNVSGRGTVLYEDRTRKNPNDTKPFRCVECDVSFRNNGKFLSHQKIHQSYRQFKCDKCSMSFTNSYTLEVHQQMHISTISPVMEQSVPSSVTIPIMTLPVMNSLSSDLESNENKQESIIASQGGTSMQTTSNGENLGIIKVISLRSIQDMKMNSHCDPLAVATAQLTTTNVESITLFDQSSYTYVIPTLSTMEIHESTAKLKRC